MGMTGMEKGDPNCVKLIYCALMGQTEGIVKSTKPISSSHYVFVEPSSLIGSLVLYLD